ncbi:hypothetical protein C4K03_2446 [Pseudomonas synxantha]|uniref:Uncharacterized protein n=1 Tax=Pseudomonas synxantha TaxID=47883 RepID=A0A3G7U5Y4_9PSED|nr:hypothetical protein [Pseudomonas synxantha]AZE54601.1 hypothetical protein C4K03_2446 [Pseudomonas synxantha]
MKIGRPLFAFALLFTISPASVVAADLNTSSKKDAETQSEPVRVNRIKVMSSNSNIYDFEFADGTLDNECGAETGPWAGTAEKNIIDVLKMAYTLNIRVKVSVDPNAHCNITSVTTVK